MQQIFYIITVQCYTVGDGVYYIQMRCLTKGGRRTIIAASSLSLLAKKILSYLNITEKNAYSLVAWNTSQQILVPGDHHVYSSPPLSFAFELGRDTDV